MTSLLPAARSPRGPVPGLRSGALRRRGFTLIELVISMGVLLVAFMIFSSTVAGVAEQRTINWESGIAANAARSVIERMQNEDFEQVFALYNADPDDDPDGIGTAPGSRFTIDDLPPIAGTPDGLVGEVLFPSAEVDVLEIVPEPDGPPGKEKTGGRGGEPESGGSLSTELQLREDLPNANLGTPRDLNGDSIIDELDHAEDYVILPVRVEVRWQGRTGPREYSIQTILCRYRRS